MSHPAAAFPFAYLLPADPRQRRDTASPLVTRGSPRRLIVLVLSCVALAGGLAAALPSGDAQAMLKHECLYDREQGSNSSNDPLLCN